MLIFILIERFLSANACVIVRFNSDHPPPTCVRGASCTEFVDPSLIFLKHDISPGETFYTRWRRLGVIESEMSGGSLRITSRGIVRLLSFSTNRYSYNTD